MTPSATERGTPLAPAPEPGPAGRAIAALTAAELRLAARRSESLLVTLVVPAAVLVMFAAVDVLSVPGDRVAFLLPGALALGVVATSFVSLGIATAYERHYGVLKRLGGAPLPRGGLVAAKILAVLAVELVQVATLVAIAALLLGWRPAGAVSAPVVTAAVGLGTACFAGLALAMVGRIRAEATLGVANGLFLVFMLLGGFVVPLDRLPSPVAAVAAVLPAAPLAELLRIGLGAPGDALQPATLLAAWTAAGVGLAVRWFRWD